MTGIASKTSIGTSIRVVKLHPSVAPVSAQRPATDLSDCGCRVPNRPMGPKWRALVSRPCDRFRTRLPDGLPHGRPTAPADGRPVERRSSSSAGRQIRLDLVSVAVRGDCRRSDQPRFAGPRLARRCAQPASPGRTGVDGCGSQRKGPSLDELDTLIDRLAILGAHLPQWLGDEAGDQARAKVAAARRRSRRPGRRGTGGRRRCRRRRRARAGRRLAAPGVSRSWWYASARRSAAVSGPKAVDSTTAACCSAVRPDRRSRSTKRSC